MVEEGAKAIPYDPIRSLRFVAFGIGSQYFLFLRAFTIV